MGSFYSTLQNDKDVPQISSISPVMETLIEDKKEIMVSKNEILRSVVHYTICLIESSWVKKDNNGTYYDVTYVYDKINNSVYCENKNEFNKLLISELKNKYNCDIEIKETLTGEVKLYSKLNIKKNKDVNKRKNKINKIKLILRNKLLEREDKPLINSIVPIVLVEN
jgi:hypothetical protein